MYWFHRITQITTDSVDSMDALGRPRARLSHSSSSDEFRNYLFVLGFYRKIAGFLSTSPFLTGVDVSTKGKVGPSLWDCRSLLFDIPTPGEWSSIMNVSMLLLKRSENIKRIFRYSSNYCKLAVILKNSMLCVIWNIRFVHTQNIFDKAITLYYTTRRAKFRALDLMIIRHNP